MSENDKDNKDFEFIKEQVIEKKRKKLKKRLLPLFMTICLAILFGIIAAVTFVIAEPRLYKFLHKEEDTKTPVTFPTPYPDNTSQENQGGSDDTDTNKGQEDTKNDPEENLPPTVNPIIQKIDARVEDFLSMHEDIRTIAYEASKSLVYINSNFTVFDIFGNSVEKTINTSGVIVASNNADYLILVSLDRVKDANSVQIKFSDNVYVNAVLQDYESELNLALLAVSIKDIPQIYLNGLQVAERGESYTLTVGTPVIALGNPNGHTGSMDIGIISSKGSWASISDNRIELFNTNMINNAYSDGVIIDMEGKLVGLITRTLSDDINEELCTAVGINKIMSYIVQMSNQKPRIYFGIKADDMTEPVMKEYNVTEGIYVSEVQSDSPAFEAGLKNGDIILSVNEHLILNTNNFYNTIAENTAGKEVVVKIKRSTGSVVKELELPVKLAEKAK
jgi:serine protease Do